MSGEIAQFLKQVPASGGSGKRSKFVQLAERRTINAIKAIRTIGKLGNKSHYEYDEQDVKKIISRLNKEVDALRMRLGERNGKESIEFTL